MTALQTPAHARTTIPRRFRIRPAQSRHPLLWVSGALSVATIIFTVALVAGKLLAHDAVALEAPMLELDPFYQQKLDAKVDELPAQF